MLLNAGQYKKYFISPILYNFFFFKSTLISVVSKANQYMFCKKW